MENSVGFLMAVGSLSAVRRLKLI